MSLLKINIEKPALVEERVYPDEDSAPATASTKPKSSDSPSLGLLKPLLGLLFVVGAALFAYKRRSGSSEDEASEFEPGDFETDDFETESGGSGKGRVFGLLAGVLCLALVARKRRSGASDE
ncbi:hypothetical protein [Haladaptatus sp.]|uniref:hypothetical protein n=1 Tax=Haladaptatus sp. TaxID=1973141 RepID=UPI003C320C30